MKIYYLSDIINTIVLLSLIKMPKFTFCVIKSDEDFILIGNDFCGKCANDKLEILTKYEVDEEEARDLIRNYQLRCVCIRCECNSHKIK